MQIFIFQLNQREKVGGEREKKRKRKIDSLMKDDPNYPQQHLP